MQPFNPLTVPLAGQKLIEASAGTGKTYSIALLFLRLIIERQLEADEILVVTFTKAATEELRNRIRNRLRNTLDLLEDSAEKANGIPDTVTADFLAALNDPQEARLRLQDALTRMDEAAVYTIHSFCQRMLQDHAFESGVPFEIEFIESEEQLRARIVEDFWRQRFYRTPAAETEWILANWQGPAALASQLLIFLSKPQAATVPEVTEHQLSEAREKTVALWERTREQWEQSGEEVMELLANDPCLSRNSRNGYGEKPLQQAIEGMSRLAAAPAMPWLLPEKIELFAASVMAEKLIKKKIAPEHPFFTFFDTFYTTHRAFTRAARVFILAEAQKFLRSELDRRKQEQAQMYFNDLLTRLDKALAGNRGVQLSQCIRDRFKVALVDEFQDTDPLQYRIFHTLFGQEPAPGLFMIGDPKQSIYSFRGADIFAYIQAGRDTPASSSFTMATNYRATTAMVKAVNRIFDRPGAFVFSGEIDFHPVHPGPGADEKPLRIGGQVSPPLQVQLLEAAEHAAAGKQVIAKDRAESGAAFWTACEIARLLRMGQSGEALIGDTPLVGGDLAILVRTHREAEIMQRELRRFEIASVYYSQDSVFETEEALQLRQILSAVNNPADEALICTALATDLFGLDARALYDIRQDRLAWSALGEEIEEYRTLWSHAGITAMFQRLLANRQAVSRLVGMSGGERKLTNFLHLVELLQEASSRYRGSDLISWFRQQINRPEKNAANQQLRLESDENLVKIVTVHKAKGLEYPILFLPFLWSARQVSSDEIFSCHVRENGQYRLVVDLGSGDKELYRQAEKERLAEDLRLLYVALTRARHCCYFTWGRISRMENAALARLLHGDEDQTPPPALLTEEKIRRDLEAINRERELLVFVPFPAADQVRPLILDPMLENLAVRSFNGRIDSSWTITSYSRLTAAPARFSDDEARVTIPRFRNDETEPMSIFTFPRGAAAGNCLHGLLESIDFIGFRAAETDELAREWLRKTGIDLAWTEVLTGWVDDILGAPLQAETTLSLNRIGTGERMVEMGFDFSMSRLDQARLNRVLGDLGIVPVELQSHSIQGLMKGYIDLIFRYQDRYYIADYKSNYLGPDFADYRLASLQEAMLEHRYDLQYLIYTVALHRYLGSRITDYAYSHHFGGVFYLFLRGMHPDRSPACGVWSDMPPFELVERLDRCFAPEEE